MGRVVFVTGGSRGIGRAMVEAFRAEGDRIATCATRIEHLADVTADLSMACDVSDAGKVGDAITRVVETFGRLDVVVNSAGLAGTNPLGPDADDAQWHRIIDVNLNGTYYVCRHAMSHLPDGTGRIINVASVLGLGGVPDQTAYTAAKHGVVGFTRALARALGPRGITVNAICPTWVRSDMARGRWADLGMTESDAAAPIPIGRIIEPEEVAALAVYLASSGAGAITGQALPIDGGVTA